MRECHILFSLNHQGFIDIESLTSFDIVWFKVFVEFLVLCELNLTEFREVFSNEAVYCAHVLHVFDDHQGFCQVEDSVGCVFVH